jgi:hypothetical protein
MHLRASDKVFFATAWARDSIHFRAATSNVGGSARFTMPLMWVCVMEQHNPGLDALRLDVGTPHFYPPIPTGMFKIPAVRFR